MIVAPLTVFPYDEVVVDRVRMTALGAQLLEHAITAINHCTGPHKEQALARLEAGNVVARTPE